MRSEVDTEAIRQLGPILSAAPGYQLQAKLEGDELHFSHHPSTADWLGDFERCLAWTWLD